MTSETIPRSGKPTRRPEQPRASLGWRRFARWDYALIPVLAAVLVFGTTQSSVFWSTTTLFFLGINIGCVAIMALPMTLVIMTGEIDLSVASMLGLSGSTLGLLWHHGSPIVPALVGALLVGVIGGALNGVLIARVGLPSIAVTIGTLALFRGLAEVLLGSATIPEAGDRAFPMRLTDIGAEPVPHTELAWGFVIFLILAIVTAVLLHLTPLGRRLHAIGLQPEAAAFAGISVKWIKFWLYVATGLISALAGIVYTMQASSISYDAGTGLELNVVAVVLFGGVSIFGGRGTVGGVVLSVLIVGSLQIALTQMQVDPNVQKVITGILLLLSVVVPNARQALTRLRAEFGWRGPASRAGASSTTPRTAQR